MRYQEIISGGFPKDISLFSPYDLNETHSFREKGKEVVHEMQSYKYETEVLGYHVEYQYNHCEECDQTRNQKIIIYEKDGRVFLHYYIKHGEVKSDT